MEHKEVKKEDRNLTTEWIKTPGGRYHNKSEMFNVTLNYMALSEKLWNFLKQIYVLLFNYIFSVNYFC